MIIELSGCYNDVKNINVDAPTPGEAASSHAVADDHDPLPTGHGLLLVLRRDAMCGADPIGRAAGDLGRVVDLSREAAGTGPRRAALRDPRARAAARPQ